MGQSASQAAAFYKDVARSGTLWTCRDEQGVPAPLKSDGRRAMPFWSTRSRVEKIIKTVPAYSIFTPLELTWGEFVSDWAPGLKKDKILAGINWSGTNATGYDLETDDVIANVSYQRSSNT